jgi:hypothetical protein
MVSRTGTAVHLILWCLERTLSVKDRPIEVFIYHYNGNAGLAAAKVQGGYVLNFADSECPRAVTLYTKLCHSKAPPLDGMS